MDIEHNLGNILTIKLRLNASLKDLVLNAPIKKGYIVCKLTVYNDNEILDTINLTVNKNIKKANILELYLKYLKDILSGNIKM